jgi:type II secretory pathway component GspD/PulD (secretin)
MYAKPIRFAIAVCFAAAAFGQTTNGQSVSQVFHFTYAQAPVDMQQITNAIRTVGEITQAYPNADAKTLAVNGTPAQLAMASWMFSTMDQPAPANQATQEYRAAGSVNDVVRILYLAHPQTPVSFQEIINAVRTIPEITKVFPCVAQNAIVMRGTDSRIAMAEWLFHQLDLPAGIQPVQDPAAHRYVLSRADLPQHDNNNVMQVFFLVHPWTPASMQQIVNTVRTIPELTKVFQCTATGAVAVRAPTATLALAAWLFNQLDQAPRISILSPQEFQTPGGADDVTQVFYLGPGTSATSLQSVVNAVRATMQKPVFLNTTLNALVLRGTAMQIAAADSLIKQMNQP